MSDADLEKLLKLIAIGQQAFIEVLNIVNNHKAQEGKSETQILVEAETKTNEARELIRNL